jgi:hypothetical protein
MATAKPLTDAADEAAFKTALTTFQKDPAYAGLDQATKDKIEALLAPVKAGGSGSRKTHKRRHRHRHSRKRHSRRKRKHSSRQAQARA